MATASNITIQASTSGAPGGFSSTFSEPLANAASPSLRTSVNLTTTPTALTIPTGTVAILITPPAGNVINLRVSGAVGETVGTTLHPTATTFLAVPTSSPNVFLFCTSTTITGVIVDFL